MSRTTQFFLAAAICSLPLMAGAQTTPPSDSSSSVKPAAKVQPADAPRSNLEAQKTEQTGNAPSYGKPGSADNTQTTKKARTKHSKMKKTNDATSGESSTTK